LELNVDYSSRRYYEKIILFLAVLLSAVLAFGSPIQDGGKIEVKVLVISLFEVDEPGGDSPGEFQNWYENYLTGAASYEIKGAALDFKGKPYPLWVNRDGVAGTVAGMGKANASATLTTLLSDRRFDWTNTYILISGCGGGPVDRTTLGDVIWAYDLVDWDLGNHFVYGDVGEDGPFFVHRESYDSSALVHLNKGLVDWAFSLSKNTALTDTDAAKASRVKYQDAKTPAVRTGTSLTGDDYWHGSTARKHVEELMSNYRTEGPYMASQMEDNSFGVVATRFGKLDRLLVLRDSVNYDSEYPGGDAISTLRDYSGAFAIGMKNNYLVGSVVVNELVKNWSQYKTSVPRN
jgi:purine nucleoside permease